MKIDRDNRKLFLICVTGLHLWEVTGQINGCILVKSWISDRKRFRVVVSRKYNCMNIYNNWINIQNMCLRELTSGPDWNFLKKRSQNLGQKADFRKNEAEIRAGWIEIEKSCRCSVAAPQNRRHGQLRCGRTSCLRRSRPLYQRFEVAVPTLWWRGGRCLDFLHRLQNAATQERGGGRTTRCRNAAATQPRRRTRAAVTP